MRSLFRRAAMGIVRFLMWLLLRMEVAGLENIPLEGAVILAISHTNFLDPVLVGALSPRLVEAVSKVENLRLFFFGPLIWLYGVIPIRRGEVDRWALSRAVEVLRRGDALLIAPEGTRSGVGRLQKGRGGLAYVAARSGAPIVPIGIVGVENFWRNLPRLRRTSVQMVLGKPFCFVAHGRPLDRRALAQMTTEAMYQIAAVLPPERRGLYADLEAATEAWLEFPGGVSNLEEIVREGL
jgi:1-acyl-sn-glycerol-3-phosphate acyltransferase